MTPYDPTAEALHRAILEVPGDDNRRLRYADRLAELGVADRAELIRLQVRLAATCPTCLGERWVASRGPYDPKGADFGKNGYIDPCGVCVPDREAFRLEHDRPAYKWLRGAAARHDARQVLQGILLKDRAIWWFPLWSLWPEAQSVNLRRRTELVAARIDVDPRDRVELGSIRFGRGFVDAVACSFEMWATRADRAFWRPGWPTPCPRDAHPVEHVTLTTVPGYADVGGWYKLADVPGRSFAWRTPTDAASYRSWAGLEEAATWLLEREWPGVRFDWSEARRRRDVAVAGEFFRDLVHEDGFIQRLFARSEVTAPVARFDPADLDRPVLTDTPVRIYEHDSIDRVGPGEG